jgi:large subunit ribosomal protein L3
LIKPAAGHFKKNDGKGFKVLREFRGPNTEDIEIGTTIETDSFAVGDKVNISGISKGRGFQGTIKRHGFSRGPETHGSGNHRAPGSIGNSATPGRVFKGKKLPGHQGVKRKTVKNLTVVDIKTKDNLLLIKGALPGFKTGILEVRKSIN